MIKIKAEIPHGMKCSLRICLLYTSSQIRALNSIWTSNNQEKVLTAPVAVSYTHLDVYKRQVLNSKETTLAQQKQQAIRDAFRDWIWRGNTSFGNASEKYSYAVSYTHLDIFLSIGGIVSGILDLAFDRQLNNSISVSYTHLCRTSTRTNKADAAGAAFGSLSL